MNQEHRRKLTEKDKDEIGRKCCNCLSTLNLEYHHIIPFALNGSDINSNMCCLCQQCHRALHHSDESYFKSIKLSNPKKPTGRPKTTYADIPLELRNDLENKNYKNITELSKKYKCSKTTIYKYIKIIEIRS